VVADFDHGVRARWVGRRRGPWRRRDPRVRNPQFV